MALLAPVRRVVFGPLQYEPMALVEGSGADIVRMCYKHDPIWKL